MAATVALAIPSLLDQTGPPRGGTLCLPTLLTGLGLVGVLLVATSWMRTVGLQRAHSSAVTMLLYTEITWCFLFDVILLANRPDAHQYLGAAIIIVGAAVYTFPPVCASPPYRCCRFCSSSDILADAELGTPESEYSRVRTGH